MSGIRGIVEDLEKSTLRLRSHSIKTGLEGSEEFVNVLGSDSDADMEADAMECVRVLNVGRHWPDARGNGDDYDSRWSGVDLICLGFIRNDLGEDWVGMKGFSACVVGSEGVVVPSYATADPRRSTQA